MGKRGPKPGSPYGPHKPTEETRKTVLAMTGYGIPQTDIATVIGITKPTLEKHYRTELDTGMTIANAKVAESLFNMATKKDNATAAIWWTKCRMGWREQVDLNLGGDALLEVLRQISGTSRGLPVKNGHDEHSTSN